MGEETVTSTRNQTPEAHLYDQYGRDIKPEQVRMKLTGDVWLCWDLKEMPALGSEVEVTLIGEIQHSFQLKEVKNPDTEKTDVAAVVTLKADRKTRHKVLSPPPLPEGSLFHQEGGGDTTIDPGASGDEVSARRGRGGRRR